MSSSNTEINGNSFIQKAGPEHSPHVELPRPKKLLLADPKPVRQARADGEKPKRGRRHKLTVLGLDRNLAEKSDPKWYAALHAANSWRKLRNKEMYIAHGYVSAGAGSLLASAALALAASRFLYEKVSETGDISLLKTASQLADSYQRHELAAWELCKRESIEKKKRDMSSDPAPWLRTLDGGENRRGPKHKHSPVALPEHTSSGETIDAEAVDSTDA
jgi:hypothetical protein